METEFEAGSTSKLVVSEVDRGSLAEIGITDEAKQDKYFQHLGALVALAEQTEQ